MTTDVKTGTFYRGDHLFKDFIKQAIKNSEKIAADGQNLLTNANNNEKALKNYLRSFFPYFELVQNNSKLTIEHKTNDDCKYSVEEFLQKCVERASKFSKEEMEQDLALLEEYSRDELDSLIHKKYQIRAPDTENELSPLEDFNMMFKTHLGPKTSKAA